MTYACNCKCKYCYEEGIRQGPDGAYMTLDMCEKISNWVKKYMILREPRLLDVCFHGGEPLPAHQYSAPLFAPPSGSQVPVDWCGKSPLRPSLCPRETL